jgi:hypothetical protein
MGSRNDVQVTQIALQSEFADTIREKDQRINCLHFQINQAQQLVKTDVELAKSMAPNDTTMSCGKLFLSDGKK